MFHQMLLTFYEPQVDAETLTVRQIKVVMVHQMLQTFYQPQVDAESLSDRHKR